MRSNRLEAFSDGVLAIIITIMVLELRAPEGDSWADFLDVLPGLGTYALSFVYVGIYWNNHHHMFQLVDRVTGAVLWGNLALLFFLSLFPFTTAWVDDSAFSQTPVVVYGINLLCAAVTYYVLQLALIRAGGEPSALREAVGPDRKGKLSPVFYLAGIAAAYVSPWISIVVFSGLAVVWLVPDRRMERYVEEHQLRAEGRSALPG